MDAVGPGDVLPLEEKTCEVARLDRLDLAPQPAQRVAVDARQQVALAPLIGRRGRAEAALHQRAFALQRQQRNLGLGGRHAQGRGQVRDGGRAEAAHAGAQQVAQGVLAAGGGRCACACACACACGAGVGAGVGVGVAGHAGGRAAGVHGLVGRGDDGRHRRRRMQALQQAQAQAQAQRPPPAARTPC
ncbi:MAG: hypothetical protein EOO24_42560, partial [Comamonadaceae bacterium]